MSRPNEHSNEEMNSHGSGNNSKRKYYGKTAGSTLLFQLPDGRMVDSKNTLQSYVAVPETSNTRRQSLLSPQPMPLQLPDGRFIDSKNTLQSYVAASPSLHSHAQAAAPTTSNIKPSPPFCHVMPPPTDTNGNVNQQYIETSVNSPPVSSNSSDQPYHCSNEEDPFFVRAQAAPVQTVLVAEGELVRPEVYNRHHSSNTSSVSFSAPPEPSQSKSFATLYQPPPSTNDTMNATNKKNTVIWLLIIILVGVVAGIGGYCGSGNCSGGESNNIPATQMSDNVSPTLPPLTINTSNKTAASPTAVPTSYHPIHMTTEVPTFSPITTTNAPTMDLTMNPTKSPTLRPVSMTNAPISPPPTISTIITNDPTSPPVVVTNAPITSTSPPTAPLIDEALTTACTFVALSSLSECQSVTSIRTTSVVGSTIPSEIGLLTQLTVLDLSMNALAGTIPSTLGLLTQLTSLQLSSNQLTGPVPSTFENLVQVTLLELYENQLTGTIPSSLCSSSTNDIIINCLEIVCTCCQGYISVTGGSYTCPRTFG
jgi:hypothetical protein